MSRSAAGNLFTEIPFPKEEGKDPHEIRKILSTEDGCYYGRNEIPLLPSLNGRVGRITSLASVTHKTVSLSTFRFYPTPRVL